MAFQQTAKGEWWKEFRTFILAANLRYETTEAQAAAVAARKDGLTPLATMKTLRERGLITAP